ncbi:MAG: hypothetical protein ACQEQ0_01615 [Bacteroidota bacterium]
MKVHVLFLLSIALLTSCSRQGKKSDSPNQGDAMDENSEEKISQAPSASFDMEEAGREEMANLLDGIWYVDDYLSTVEETRSVWEATQNSDVYQNVISCSFSKENLMSSSPIANGGSIHQQGFVSKLMWDEEAKSFKKYPDGYNNIAEEPFAIYILNDSLMEFRFDDGREPRKYRKMKEGGLSRWLNNLLFTGTYELKDGRLVKFHSDGKLESDSGLFQARYHVVYDFFGLSMDAIRVTPRSAPASSGHLFHYKMLEDGFEFYEIVGDMEKGYELGNFANTLKHTEKELQFSPESNLEASTNYFDLPPDAAKQLKELLGTDDLKVLDQSDLEVMEEYLTSNLLSRSRFGPRISSNYFWYVYNALPDFVSGDERHSGYYAHADEKDLNARERLLAYAIYRIDRSPENIQRLFDSFKPLIPKLVSPATYDRMNVREKVNGLIQSYEMVTSFENYEEKLSKAYAVADTMTGQFVDHGSHREFRKFENSAYGFSAHDLNMHVMEHLLPEDHGRIHNMPADPSFWMRRNHEGNMEVVYSILQEIREMYLN